MANKLMPDEKIVEPLRKVLRVATKKDIRQIEESKQHTCKIEVSAKLVKRFSV